MAGYHEHVRSKVKLMDIINDVLGLDLSEERLTQLLAAFDDISREIKKLRSLDLTNVHPAVIFDPLLGYRGDDT
jgi:hypothetical protein